MGDGTGAAVVDTTSGPIQISSVAASNAVELSDLIVGSQFVAEPAIQVSGCAGVVVFDALTIGCDAAHTAVSVSSSPGVAVQRCAISGGTGLSVSTASHVALSSGSLTSLVSTMSTIEMANLTPGSMSVSPAGSVTSRGGLMPDLILPEFASMAHPQALTIDAFPNAPYIVVWSSALKFNGFPQFEMPVLIDTSNMLMLAPHVTDAVGHGVIGFEIEPQAFLLGYTYVVQAGCLDPVAGTWRFSNVETMVSMP
jgi:hypothetical protein